ncbi:hypothetical protein B0H12DRAFT_1080993 [Mycena haematopus]|nr:hypothetical protein B0H12DRAFT_1080993 [Mycena haematopus]
MSDSEENIPAVTTPVRSGKTTARISTGGGHLATEESSGKEDIDADDLNTSEADFIDDSEVKQSHSIEWTPSPSPMNVDTLSEPEDFDNGNAVKHNTRASKGKKKAAETIAKIPALNLNTKGYTGSSSDRAPGKKSSAIVLGTDSSATQTTLDSVSSNKGTNSSKYVTLDRESADYQAFLKFTNDAKTKETAKHSSSSQKAKRKNIRRVVTKAPKQENKLASPFTPKKKSNEKPDIEDDSLLDAPVEAFTAKRDSTKQASTKNTTKRKRDDDADVEDETFPDAPVQAFSAKQEEAKESPTKKTRPSDAFLETTKKSQPRSSPQVCEVMVPAVQDDLLKPVYNRGLPKLKYYFYFIKSYSTFVEPQIRSWHVYVLRICAHQYAFFPQDKYVNLARIDPAYLECVCQIYNNIENKWVLSIKDRTATAGSLARSDADNIPLSKFVTLILLSQEFDRMVGTCGMVFNKREMNAQLNADALTFSTKTVTKKQLAQQSGSGSSSGVQSSSTRYKQSSSLSSTEALNYDAEVPVYDGRDADLNAKDCIDDLDAALPRYKDNGGEIPNNSCTVVGYTVTHWLKSGEPQISFNIRWAIVMGDPAL